MSSRGRFDIPAEQASSVDYGSAVMQPASSASDADLFYRTRLAQAYAFFVAAALVIATVNLVAAYVFASMGLAVAGLTVLVVALGILASRRLLLRHRDAAASALLIMALFTGGVTYTIVRPGSFPAVALLPIVVIVLAMPIVQDAALRRLAVAAWIAGVGLVTLNLGMVSDPGPASMFTLAMRSGSFGVVLAGTLVLLIIHRRRLADALRVMHEGAESIRTANKQLVELDRAKTNFMNKVSHELRTPMTPVILQLDLFSNERFGPLTDRQRRSLKVVERNVRRLSSVADELLDVARLQSDRLRLSLESVDLDAIVAEAVDSFRDVAAAQGLRIIVSFAADARVPADPKRISQVLYNLLGNAMKFTPGPGRVQIETRNTGDRVEVSVSDSGLGVRPEDLPGLFQPFSQFHSSQAVDGSGVGLGLFICQEILHAHRGRLWVESEGVGRGTTFTFCLPVVSPATEPGPIGQEPKIAARVR